MYAGCIGSTYYLKLFLKFCFFLVVTRNLKNLIEASTICWDFHTYIIKNDKIHTYMI